MRLRISILALFCASLAAQVPAPQLNLTGNIGCQGFPCVNSGTLIMATDANHTMTVQETSAFYLKVTSSVSLTATRNLIAPAGRFPFTIENATTGGQSIQVIGPTGTGITIANGATVAVWNDGTNFVQVGPTGATGLSGMTTGQIPVAATSSTVTSSLPTTGTGNVVLSASPTLTGTTIINALTTSNSITGLPATVTTPVAGTFSCATTCNAMGGTIAFTASATASGTDTLSLTVPSGSVVNVCVAGAGNSGAITAGAQWTNTTLLMTISGSFANTAVYYMNYICL